MALLFIETIEDTPQGTAEGDSFSALKELAKSDLGVLKQIAYLNKQYHGDDPRFSDKQSAVAMASILSKLLYADDRTAYFMGSMDWKPNISVWMRFFDMVGDEPLGKFLGINSSEELPTMDGTSGLDGVFDGTVPSGPSPDASAQPLTAPQPPPPPNNEINSDQLV